MAKTTRVHVGNVGVDAGILWFGDPCYIMGDTASSRQTDWGEFCTKLFKAEEESPHIGASSPLGDGVGVCTSTGYGDGYYPVYVEYSDEGDWGTRVKSVTVEFIGDDYEG
jgi:hypothetical protein